MQCKHYFHWKRSKISKQQPLLCVHWFVSYRETPFFFCLGWDILRRSQKNLLPLCDVSMSDQATSYRLAENPHCIRYSWSSVETGILCSSQKATIYFQRFASAGLSGCQLPSNRVWETLGSRKKKTRETHLGEESIEREVYTEQTVRIMSPVQINSVSRPSSCNPESQRGALYGACVWGI